MTANDIAGLVAGITRTAISSGPSPRAAGARLLLQPLALDPDKRHALSEKIALIQ